MLAKKLKKNGAAKEEAEANEGESYMFINKKKPAADKNNTNVANTGEVENLPGQDGSEKLEENVVGNDEELEASAPVNDGNVDNDSEGNDSNSAEVKEVENGAAE